MTQAEFRALCSALGFVAARMREASPAAESTLGAKGYAKLIEDFCREAVPEAFADTEKESVLKIAAAPPGEKEEKFALASRMANSIAALYREKGGCLPQDLIPKGFTCEEIDGNWSMAKALASVELNMRDA